MIEIRVLGRLDLQGSEGEGYLSILAQPKRAALLAYLAVATPRGFHRRDKLIGLFWPEGGPEHARGALRSALYFLGQSLGDGLIAGRGAEELGLAAEAFQCDAVGFESALEAGQPEKALELYRGDLLEGFYVAEAPEFERWLEGERERLRARAAEAAWTLAEDQEAAGNGVEAAKWARKAVSFSPDDEGGLRRLLELLDRVGDRAGAMKEYEAFARRLQDEYEGEPSPETQALIATIREPEKAASDPATAGAKEFAEAVTTTLGGEQRERSELRWALGRRKPAVAAVVVVAMAALAVWGVVATGWVPFGGGKGSMPEVAAERLSIAALPFENRSGLEEDEYFADGIHDEILGQLSKIGALSVRGRTSVMHYRESPKNLRQIGEELNAQYLLEGGVQRAGKTIRINVQLIDAETDEHLWAETYDEDLTADNILRIQTNIAQRIATALRAQLTPKESERLAASPTASLEAYDAYLLGNTYSQRTSRPEAMRQAIQWYKKAVELDSAFAEAHAALARTRIRFSTQHGKPVQFDTARADLDRAVELGPDLSVTHLALGDYYRWGEYFGVVERGTERALGEYALVKEREPSNVEALSAIAEILWRRGEWDEALQAREEVARLDPRNPNVLGTLADTYRVHRRFEEAERLLDRASSLAPEVAADRVARAQLYLLWSGDAERASRIIEEAFDDLDPADVLYQLSDHVGERWLARIVVDSYAEALEGSGLEQRCPDCYQILRATIYGQRNDSAMERLAFDSLLHGAERIREDYPPRAITLGMAYAGLGRKAEAIRAAESAMAEARGVGNLSRQALYMWVLAEIYVTTGEYEAAIDRLEYLLSIPYPMSVSVLRLDPLWDPLRDHPRFQAMLEKY
jgi:serine/threonine-protein kinase